MTAFPVTTRTPAGWPVLVQDDYLRTLPAYSAELADKLGADLATTGAIDLSGYIMTPNAAKIGAEPIMIARIGPLVIFQAALQINPASVARTLLRFPAKGFKPIGAVKYLPNPYGSAMAASITVTDAGAYLTMTGHTLNTAIGYSRFDAVWYTKDARPATLPGPLL